MNKKEKKIMIYFSGRARSGKTTLAHAVAAKLGWDGVQMIHPFYDTDIGYATCAFLEKWFGVDPREAEGEMKELCRSIIVPIAQGRRKLNGEDSHFTNEIVGDTRFRKYNIMHSLGFVSEREDFYKLLPSFRHLHIHVDNKTTSAESLVDSRAGDQSALSKLADLCVDLTAHDEEGFRKSVEYWAEALAGIIQCHIKAKKGTKIKEVTLGPDGYNLPFLFKKVKPEDV